MTNTNKFKQWIKKKIGIRSNKIKPYQTIDMNIYNRPYTTIYIPYVPKK